MEDSPIARYHTKPVGFVGLLSLYNIDICLGYEGRVGRKIMVDSAPQLCMANYWLGVVKLVGAYCDVSIIADMPQTSN